MATELIDIYDENNERIGSETRAEAQRKGMWIRSFHCWVVDKSSESVIFQKRSAEKKIYPNFFDISAAGHYTKGEGVEAGVRELREELGLSREISDLHFLGVRTEVAKVGQAIVREFAYTYFLIENLPIEEIEAADGEVAGVSYVPIVEGLRIFGGDKGEVSVRSYLRDGKDWTQTNDSFRADSVIPRKDPYYLKVFIMAERALSNAGALAI